MLSNLEAGASTFEDVLSHFLSVRQLTESLCEPLQPEDFNLQAMAETSPVKWHLAHTSWFFETFVLKRYEQGFKAYHPEYEYLFNSYYNSVGEQFPRPSRHLLSRPSVDEVFEYRRLITHKVAELLQNLDEAQQKEVLPLLVLGINHEQQHQELLLTDLKYNLYQNPLLPAYRKQNTPLISAETLAMEWFEIKAGLVKIGKNLAESVEGGFCFDNESPRHQHHLQDFKISNRLVINAEYLEFIKDGGYQRPEFWLSDGWAMKTERNWSAPLYWFNKDENWYHYTLNGVKSIQPNEPVTHISYYEADAFASWKGARLPTEQEWECVAQDYPVKGTFLESKQLVPQLSSAQEDVSQLYGELWQWTSSSYSPYPGYQPLAGAVGEYNGKFMANQFVLRGGSCVSARDHLRASYRNFFYPDARWQFSGIRLAKNT